MNDITRNPNIHPSRTSSPDHNDPRANVFDKINARLNEIKKTNQKTKVKQDDSFFGYVLYSVPITISEFSQMFPPETPFHKEVLLGGGTAKANTSAKPGASIIECRIHIPEITGFLPLPDHDLIFSALRLPKVTVKTYEKEYKKRLNEFKKQYPEARKKAFKEIMKINLYPKFYFYTENSQIPTMGQFCKVKFSKSLPQETKGVGIYLEGYDASIDD
jgi:hypothetical protein